MDATGKPIPPWACAIEKTGAALHGFFVNHSVLLFVLFPLLFVLGAVLAPVLTASGHPLAGAVLHGLYRPFCHQIPSRCFSVLGIPAALCARCFAVEATVAFLLAASALSRSPGSPRRSAAPMRPLPWPLFSFLLAPGALEYLGEALGVWQGTVPLRTATGVLAGCAVSGRFVPPLLAVLRKAKAYYRSEMARRSVTQL